MNKAEVEANRLGLNVDLYKEYRRLAKQADQRLVRLEALRHEEHFRNVTSWAYSKAMKDIKSWGGDKRFNTAPPRSEAELRAKIADIKSFIEKPTSTKSQILKTYRKRADTINKQYGTNFTWEQLAKYYESGLASKLDSKLGSSTALHVIAELQRKPTDIIDAIKASDEQNIRVSDKKIQSTVTTLLSEHGKDFASILK